MICNCNLPFIKQNYQKISDPIRQLSTFEAQIKFTKNLILSDSFDSIEIHATPYFI